jgi:hypothetical protein
LPRKLRVTGTESAGNLSYVAGRGSHEALPTKGRRRAAGIYGAIVTAALLTAAGASLSTAAMSVSVLITLIVYWLAEEYAHVLGEQAADGKPPTRGQVRAGLAARWPIVSASFAPLAILVVARVGGATASAAANFGIAAAIVLLTGHGWAAGRAAHQRGWQLLATTAVAAVLGLVMVLLKNLVILHLH